jgi:hypothetical protein
MEIPQFSASGHVVRYAKDVVPRCGTGVKGTGVAGTAAVVVGAAVVVVVVGTAVVVVLVVVVVVAMVTMVAAAAGPVLSTDKKGVQ